MAEPVEVRNNIRIGHVRESATEPSAGTPLHKMSAAQSAARAISRRGKLGDGPNKRRATISLAQAIREMVEPEEHARWLLEFSRGKDPDVAAGGTDFGYARPTMSERLKARVHLMEFAYGTAPQRVQIEAELRATIGSAGDLDFSKMSKAELAQFRSESRRLLARVSSSAVDAIDTVATERRDVERTRQEADAACDAMAPDLHASILGDVAQDLHAGESKDDAGAPER